HTRFSRDWSSDVCSSDLGVGQAPLFPDGLEQPGTGPAADEAAQDQQAVSVPVVDGSPFGAQAEMDLLRLLDPHPAVPAQAGALRGGPRFRPAAPRFRPGSPGAPRAQDA